MKYFIAGARGMLGRAFQEALSYDAQAEVTLGLRPDFDVLSHTTYALIPRDTDVIVNCTAYTAVDKAETEEEEAHRLNGEAVAQLAAYSREIGALLVHFGTDYVFDGKGTKPYPVEYPIAPVNAYGRSKAAGEVALAASGASYLHLRTSWLYAAWGSNFVLTIAKAAQTRDSLRVVNDQRGRPSSVRQLVETTRALIACNARGTFHATDGGECSWFEFAQHIASRVRPECRVEPCSSEEFPRPAARPSYSVLDLSTTEALIGPRRSWQDEVDDVLRTIKLTV